MRCPSPTVTLGGGLRSQRAARFVCWQCRSIQISAAPSTDSPDAFGASFEASRDMADARFEVLGSPYSMLSVTLSASQKLYTRRGTLVAVAGKPDHVRYENEFKSDAPDSSSSHQGKADKVMQAQSTLSLLNPLTRAALGIPFLYQRISSTTPITALISTKATTTTFSVLHLDGTTDWIVSQRNALLAWTGHTLTLTPRVQRRLALAHWGSTHVTGRGLVALSAPGQAYRLMLGEGEELVAHPGSVVAYAVSRHAPQPFRFKSTSLRIQVPWLTSWIPEFEFTKTVRRWEAYRFLARTLYALRTVTRRTIWGDRLFLRFTGPCTIVMSSRGVRVADVLTREQVNEIADAPAGALPAAVAQASGLKGPEEKEEKAEGKGEGNAASNLHVAGAEKDGKVTFEDGKALKETLR